MEEKDFQKRSYFILIAAFVVLLGFLFKTLSSVFLPIVTAVLLSCVFAPIIQKLNYKFKIPWVISTILIALMLLVALILISTILVTSMTTIVSEYPRYETKFLSIYKIIAQNFSLEFDEGKGFFDNIWQYLKVREYIQSFALALSSGLVSSGKNIILVLFLMVFLLIEYRLTNRKINHAFVGKAKGKILRLIKRIILETVRYISIKFYISFATGVLVFLVSLIFGLDFPVVWAFIAFIMNFIPTFGSIFSCSLTTIFALLQFYPHSSKVIAIAILMIAINFSLGNVLEPRIEGKHLGLSPFIILISLTLWGYIWGLIGMLIAVPMTVIVKIICENISYLHIFAILLGNDPLETKRDIINDTNNE